MSSSNSQRWPRIWITSTLKMRSLSRCCNQFRMFKCHQFQLIIIIIWMTKLMKCLQGTFPAPEWLVNLELKLKTYWMGILLSWIKIKILGKLIKMVALLWLNLMGKMKAAVHLIRAHNKFLKTVTSKKIIRKQTS